MRVARRESVCSARCSHDGVAALGSDDLRRRWLGLARSAWAAWIRFSYARLDGSWLVSDGYQASTFVRASAGLASVVHSTSLKRCLFLMQRYHPGV